MQEEKGVKIGHYPYIILETSAEIINIHADAEKLEKRKSYYHKPDRRRKLRFQNLGREKRAFKMNLHNKLSKYTASILAKQNIKSSSPQF